MREFTSAVEDIIAEDERAEKIAALVAEGKTQAEAEREVDEEEYSEFKVDGRVLRAYHPTDGQLAFMLATLGRGQSADQRFAAILNIMFSTMRGEDQDYLEGRLLTRDRKQRLPMKMIESIFEGLTEDWFATPTQPPSDSAGSLPSAGEK